MWYKLYRTFYFTLEDAKNKSNIPSGSKFFSLSFRNIFILTSRTEFFKKNLLVVRFLWQSQMIE